VKVCGILYQHRTRIPLSPLSCQQFAEIVTLSKVLAVHASIAILVSDHSVGFCAMLEWCMRAVIAYRSVSDCSQASH